MDVLTKEQRSYNMSRIKANRTKPELLLIYKLRRLGFSYQPKLYGRPDFVSIKTKTVIFVDGCFWHKCPKCYKEPAVRKKFWTEKIMQNKKRDNRVNRYLRKEGWTVIRIWEHNVRKSIKDCLSKISNSMGTMLI